jgi:hypothetical protein
MSDSYNGVSLTTDDGETFHFFLVFHLPADDGIYTHEMKGFRYAVEREIDRLLDEGGIVRSGRVVTRSVLDYFSSSEVVRR